jgi:hypothetical protein
MSNNLQHLLTNSDDDSGNGERLRLIAIGSREGVAETIRTLHALGY